MKQKGFNPVQLGPAVICSGLSFMGSDKTIGADITEVGTSWEQYIAVIPPGFLLTHEKFDKILAEYGHKGKPLSADDVISLFIKHNDPKGRRQNKDEKDDKEYGL